MAKLVYDDTGRLLFTKEMKEEYTILMPQMLPVHFGMFQRLLELEGYKVDMLTSNHRGIIDEGLKYVHNDTCYPALLVIGQLIDAIKHGGYDPHKVALFITQTGGGCRASNYIHLLRKALEKADLAFVPVISVNLSGLEKNPGFSLTLPIIRKMVYAMMYGDIIVNVANQVRPYERERGATDAMVSTWQGRLIQGFQQGKGMSRGQMRTNFDAICAELERWSPELASRPMLVAANKVDIMQDPALLEQLRTYVESQGMELFEISAAAHMGTRELMKRAAQELQNLPPVVVYESTYVERPPEVDTSGEVEIRQFDDTWVVEAPWLQRLMANVNFGDYESRNWFDQKLRQSGLFDKLESMGIKDGDIVSLYDLEFEYQR